MHVFFTFVRLNLSTQPLLEDDIGAVEGGIGVIADAPDMGAFEGLVGAIVPAGVLPMVEDEAGI